MSDTYKGSFAQRFIKFLTQIVSETSPGDNFSNAMIFVDYTDQATYFVADPHVDTLTEVTPDDYADITKGLLKTWLDGFYLSGSQQSVFLVTFDPGSDGDGTDLATQYGRFWTKGYWKLAISSTFKEAVNVALATLCENDPLSQFAYGTNDATAITATCTELGWFVSAGLDVPIAYHPSATMNAALVQLGETLAFANSTGTMVGNKSDTSAISGFTASGDAGANPTPTEYGYLETHNIAYFIYVGDETTDVVLTKWSMCTSKRLPGARWVVNYIDIVVAIYVARYLAENDVSFKNNDTYQATLNILQVNGLNLFRTLGRLANVLITAPVFSNLPPAAGDTITVPNAWQADYLDNVREETVYGKLTVQL